MSTLLPFKKLRNIRDLGGMKTTDGRSIRSGLLIRSGHLSKLDPSDLNALQDLVDLVIDFRTDRECLENPDVVMDGVVSVRIPIFDQLTEGITREEEADHNVFSRYLTKPSEAKQYMCRLYRSFAKEKAVSGFAGFLRYLLESGQKTVLWHCTAGKDRAGIASVLVEEVLGADREDIVADYMKTNEYLKDDILFLTDFIKKQASLDFGAAGDPADESLRYLLGAQEEYINSFYSAVEETYGSVDRLIRDGLKLTEEEISSLKSRYLV